MTRTYVAFFVFFLISTLSWGASPYHVGYQNLEQPFDGRVWYPISDKIKEEPIPASKLFRANNGKENAQVIIEPQMLPLLLLSHGSGGTFDRLDWVADYFARRGWIVAAINHPGNTLTDNTVEGFVQVWKRPELLSRFLDYLLNRHPIRDRIDKKRIMAVGHSSGGTTVIMLAGGRLSRNRFQNPIPFCRPLPKEYDDEHCSELRNHDFTKYPGKWVEKSYKDKRIKAAVAIDPAFTRSFQLNQKTSPVLFLLAGKLKDPSGEIFVKEWAQVFPRQNIQTIPHSIHISFISQCSSFGLKFKAPICYGDKNRADIQKRAYQEMEKFFRKWDP